MDGSRYDISERVTDPTMFVQYLYVKNMPLIATDPLGLMLDRQAGDSNSSKRTVVYTVTENNVNMRVSAGLHGTVIRQVNKGDTLTALGQETFNDGYYWAKVQYSGVSGWVAKAYLQPKNSMPGASNLSDKQLQLNEQKQQNTVPKVPTTAVPEAKTSEVSPWDSAVQDITWEIERIKYEFEQTITHYANVATALGQVFTDDIRGEDFERGILTSVIIDSGTAGAQMIQALASAGNTLMPWLPEVDFYNAYLQSGDAFDEYALSLSHYGDSYYLGRMIGDTVAEAFGLGMSVAAVIEMIGGGAAAVGGTVTSGTGIGAVIGVAGAAITAEGVATLVSGEAIAAAAAANHGVNSGKFDEYFNKAQCEGSSHHLTPQQKNQIKSEILAGHDVEFSSKAEAVSFIEEKFPDFPQEVAGSRSAQGWHFDYHSMYDGGPKVEHINIYSKTPKFKAHITWRG